MKKISINTKTTAVFASGLLLILIFTAAGQSGRRGDKSTQTTPAVPVKNETPKPSPTPLKPRVVLSVVMADLDGFSRINLGSQSAALQGCVDRLNESVSVKIASVNRDVPRGEAIKKAKAASDIHVAWLRIDLDTMSANTSVNPDIRDVFIEYTLFAAGTAKVLGSGRTYPHRPNRSVIPNTRTGGLYGDHLYVLAGREAAEKILSTFHLPTRPVLP